MANPPSEADIRRTKAHLEEAYHPSLRGIVALEPMLSMLIVHLNHRLDVETMATVAESEGYRVERVKDAHGVVTRIQIRTPDSSVAPGLDRVAIFHRSTRLNLRTGTPIAEDGTYSCRDAEAYLSFLTKYLRERYSMYMERSRDEGKTGGV